MIPKTNREALSIHNGGIYVAFVSRVPLEFDFSLKVSQKCITANVVCVKFIFANDGHV